MTFSLNIEDSFGGLARLSGYYEDVAIPRREALDGASWFLKVECRARNFECRSGEISVVLLCDFLWAELAGESKFVDSAVEFQVAPGV